MIDGRGVARLVLERRQSKVESATFSGFVLVCSTLGCWDRWGSRSVLVVRVCVCVCHHPEYKGQCACFYDSEARGQRPSNKRCLTQLCLKVEAPRGQPCVVAMWTETSSTMLVTSYSSNRLWFRPNVAHVPWL